MLAFDGTWTAGPAGTRLLAQVAAPSCEGFASGTYHYPGELTDVAFVGNNVEVCPRTKRGRGAWVGCSLHLDPDIHC